MLLSWGSCSDSDLFIAEEFSYRASKYLLVEISSDCLALAIDIDKKLFKLGEEVIAEVLEGVDEGMACSFVDEEKGVVCSLN